MIDFVCSGCGKSLQVKDEYAGKSTRCPACQTKIVVPEPAGAFAAEPLPAAPEPPPPMPEPAPAGFRSDGGEFRQEPGLADAGASAPSPVMDYLLFRRMIVPVIIQVIFWGGVFLNTILSFVMMIALGGAGGVMGGLLLLILGPVSWRITCEIMMVVFRINETLVDIKDELKRRPQ